MERTTNYNTACATEEIISNGRNNDSSTSTLRNSESPRIFHPGDIIVVVSARHCKTLHDTTYLAVCPQQHVRSKHWYSNAVSRCDQEVALHPPPIPHKAKYATRMEGDAM